MHEMGIAMQIVDIAKSAIPENMKDAEIASVNLKVGKLTAIVPESLRFCWSVVSKDTPLEGAALNIEEIPIRAVCQDCYDETVIEEADFTCKKCNSAKMQIISGRELTVSSLELADD